MAASGTAQRLVGATFMQDEKLSGALILRDAPRCGLPRALVQTVTDA